MADSKVPPLTEVSVPALDDLLYLVDVSDTTDDASGSSRRVQLDRLAAFVNPAVAQGRLTLETGVPVSTSDQTAKTTIYFTPYRGNRLAVFDGTRWELYAFSELSLALGTLTADKNYDVFVYDNAGTLTLELSAAWTNNTTRADALALQDGVYVKSGATTRRYLGTIRTTSTTETEDSAAKRFVWNAYNRVARKLLRIETNVSWTYTTDTWRQANGSDANQVAVVVGLASEALSLSLSARATNASTGAVWMTSVGVDSATTPSTDGHISRVQTAVALTPDQAAVAFTTTPGIGYHYFTWLERCTAVGTTTWTGFTSGTAACGLVGTCHA